MKADSRAQVRRKWTLDRSGGPVVLAGEIVVKKMLQHYWPCAHQPWDSVKAGAEHGYAARVFVPLQGAHLGADFDRALATCVRVVSADTGARIALDGRVMWLDGPHRINAQGKLVYGPGKSYFGPGDEIESALERFKRELPNEDR